MKSRHNRFLRFSCLYVAINILAVSFIPGTAYALTAGPASPEFSSFTPVSSTEMVNTFTGDFSYNLPVIEVPGPHDSGYSLSLSYNSGNTAEMEASWVGFGWNLSPGSINRSVRGLPDDYNGKEITYLNKMRPNWTATSTARAGMELFSKDLSMGLSASNMHRINNYTGYQNVKSFGVNFNGCVGLDVSKDVNGVTYRPYVSPLGLFNTFFKKTQKDPNRTAIQNRDRTYEARRENRFNPSVSIGGLNLGANTFSVSLLPPTPKPFNYPEYNGISINWSASVQANPSSAPVGLEGGKMGTFSYRYNVARSSPKAYGYNHTQWADMDKEKVSDYFVEKDRPFHVSNYFIGIPYSSYDIYNVSGEGIGGSFRPFLSQNGHWSPRKSSSKTRHIQRGFEVMVGANIGAGLDFGAGYQKTTVSDWYHEKENEFSANNVMYRFSNDMGGQIFYGEGETAINRAGISEIENANYSGTPTDNLRPFQRENSGNSAYIKEIITGGIITGMDIVNKDGIRLLYNEPIKVRNETSLTINIDPDKQLVENRFYAFAPLALSQSRWNGQYRVDDSGIKEHQTLMGQINPNEYASNFLLTEILTSSYIDSDDKAGVSVGDFGGWTRFSYRTAFGGNGTPWYRYRMPYNGLHYQQNSISDPKDDTGSVDTGEKQVKYLYTIETKTHIAYFVTNKTENDNPYLRGSGNDRYDGTGAKELLANDDPASTLSDNEGVFESDTKLEYLEKIVLFTKRGDDNLEDYQKPVKTVRFEYDYSLVPNVANNINSNFNYYQKSKVSKENNGKLTLRRVWFEYEGVVSANISPYVFDYHYPVADKDSKLAAFFSAESALTDDLQNPPYAPYALDAWGNQSPNSEERRNNGVAWVDQSAFVDETLRYDPAAYQLKSIRLPSGGSIHVQYEPGDYAHVHDRTAMAMARVALPQGARGPSYETDSYFINTEDLGVDSSNEMEVRALAAKINAHFLGDGQDNVPSRKIYFKYLFSLLDDAPGLNNYRSEYITGYADFDGASVVCLDSNGESGCAKFGIEVEIGGREEDEGGGNKSLTPRMACWEFVANQRQGKIASANGIEPHYEAIYDNALSDMANGGDPVDILRGSGTVIDLLTDMALGKGLSSKGYQNIKKEDPRVGQRIAEDYSFLKLPVLNNKYGGGARVKRLLLHDPGIESGDEVVLGTEYRYVMEDGITSSGVATNEPALAREENPLVDFMPRKGEKWWKQLVSGEVLDQLEGPIGESILPGASIGYRRVVSENIHKGKTGNGFTIDEYFTVYDFPFDRVYPGQNDEDLDFDGSANASTSLAKSSSPDLKILTGLFNYIDSKQALSQGFRFLQVNTHGLQKRTATYSGDYDQWMAGTMPSYIVAGQEFEYFKPGEKIQVLEMDSNGELVSGSMVPGKEVDIARESKHVKDVSLDFSVEIDISVGLPLIIFVGVWPAFTYTNNELFQHATTKLISYPSILKSVTTTVEGISSKSENIAFNKFTGDPVMVKNSDSYSGSYNPLTGENREGDLYSFSIPASWVYKEMGQKAEDESYSNQLNSQVANFLVHDVKPDAEWLNAPQNLISAVVNTYANQWGTFLSDESRITDMYPGFDDARTDMNEKWLPKASYTYKEEVDNASDASKRGTFNIGRKIWGVNKVFTPEGWLKTNETTKYSPNSEALEQIDVLGIPSAVLYGSQYGNNVPVMVAENANYNSLLFRDFEAPGASSEVAHSGRNAETVDGIDNLLPGIIATPLLKQQGGLIQFWLNESLEGLKLVFSGVETAVEMEAVSSVEGWTLYRGVIEPIEHLGTLSDGTELVPLLVFGEDNPPAGLFIDDIRFQPLHATATAYVYNPFNYRLITQFDDQHFGTYFQYNKEGKLVRKVLETERGRHTLQEMHYNTPKVNR
ncbi:hypothetical protein [Marinilabilia sp.]|uniref:hypothetical protein n=1 Tax=Marinilabilia sp. TaxID=2021252 RepID=UPI0025BD2C38|nr:hypothetical protein [Marinilabilia sp.]